MPANRKRPDQRQDNSTSRELASVTQIAGRAPAQISRHKPGTGWAKSTRDQWEEFWEADVAQVLAAHHVPAVYRLFELRDAQARALRIYKREPMVQGSMKQPVVNPAMATVQALEKDIRALEDRLGLTPKAQANLGIKLGQASLTAAELNRMAQEDDDDDDSGSAGSSRAGGAQPDEQSGDVVEGEWIEGWAEA